MNFKSLMLGAAAAVAATGAQAADLPVAPEPVDYVRICDAYGAGFYYIPGTETCLRVGGRIRADYRAMDFASDGGNMWDDPSDFGAQFRARAYVRLDSRTNTEYGLLRTYTDVWFTNTTGAGNALTVWDAFIQFGGVTAGRTGSFFDHWTGTSWGAIIGQGLDDRANVLAYTAAFGNGVSATLSLEDGSARRLGFTTGTRTGSRVPDVVANILVSQGWGSAQLSGVVSQLIDVTPGVDREYGWAIAGDVDFALPMLAPGDSFGIRAAYGDGAIGYVNENLTADGRVVGTNLRTATAWGIAAGFTHNWTSTVSTSVTGTYASLDMPATVAQDVDQWSLHGTLAWAPVSGLVIGTEVEYLSQDFGGATADDDDLTAVFRIQRTF